MSVAVQGWRVAVGPTEPECALFDLSAAPTSVQRISCSVLPSLQGRAVPPLIKHDVASIDFGVIPFGFEEVRAVTLTNTSGAQQAVKARLVRRIDETYDDISIDPEELVIPPGESRKVDVILRPSKAHAYLEDIAFDLPGLIENHFILPLRGSSKTPQVAIEPESTLIMEDVFVNTPAAKLFTIRNTSRLSAQFSVTLEVRC